MNITEEQSLQYGEDKILRAKMTKTEINNLAISLQKAIRYFLAISTSIPPADTSKDCLNDIDAVIIELKQLSRCKTLLISDN